VPLPEEKVSEMFKRIRQDDEIDLRLIYQALIGSQTALRAEAARYLGTHGDDSSIPHLIDALSDQSIHDGVNYPVAGMATTRYWANDSLKKLTGLDFGFVWDDPIDKRNEAINRWRDWYRGTRKTSD
jgi:HEAT repeat protein